MFTYIKHLLHYGHGFGNKFKRLDICRSGREEEVNPIHIWYCLSSVEEKARGHLLYLLFAAFVKMPLQFFA